LKASHCRHVCNIDVSGTFVAEVLVRYDMRPSGFS